MNPLWIALGVVVVLYVIYRLVQYIWVPRPSLNRVGKEQYDLSAMSQVLASEELKNAWSSTEGATFVACIYPEVNDRTSISGNEYANVVQIGSKQVLKLLVAPDAGRGYSMAPAILDVHMKGYDKPESIEIPNIPLQRWTTIAIVKEGRKFNIYSNGKLSISHMCTGMPDFDDTQPLRVGDARLGGKIALVSIAAYPMKTKEVQSTVASVVDTNGMPYLSSGMPILVPNISDALQFFMCPGGNCNSTPKAGPMEEWTSPYA